MVTEETRVFASLVNASLVLERRDRKPDERRSVVVVGGRTVGRTTVLGGVWQLSTSDRGTADGSFSFSAVVEISASLCDGGRFARRRRTVKGRLTPADCTQTTDSSDLGFMLLARSGLF